MSKGAEDLTTPSPWCNGVQMRQWLQDQKVFSSRQTVPSAASCEALAETADGLRLWIDASRRSWRADRDRKRRISEAVSILINDLPHIEESLAAAIDVYRRKDNEAGQIGARLAQRKLSVVQGLNSELVAFRDCPAILVSVLSITDDVDRWHEYGQDLVEAFREAARTVNPNEPFTLSNNGPATRFLAAAIPHISGERPSTVAIARYFGRAGR